MYSGSQGPLFSKSCFARRSSTSSEDDTAIDIIIEDTKSGNLALLFGSMDILESQEESSKSSIPSVKCAHSNDLLKISWCLQSVSSRYRTDKRNNEDRISVKYNSELDSIVVFIVVDGHGGDFAAEFVSSLLGSELLNRIKELNPNPLSTDAFYRNNTNLVIQTIVDAYTNIDRQLCESCRSALPPSFYQQSSILRGQLKPASRHDLDIHMKSVDVKEVSQTTPQIWGSGCVAASVIIVSSLLFIAGLGDCSVLLKTENSWKDLLPIHHPIKREEKKRIRGAGGHVRHNSISGLGVSRSFGDVPYKESYYNMSKISTLRANEDIVVSIPFVCYEVITSDVLFCVIGSDGLFNALEKSVVIRMIADCAVKKFTGEAICERIIDAAKSQYDKNQSSRMDDDISLCIIFFNQSFFVCSRMSLLFRKLLVPRSLTSLPITRSFSEKVVASKSTEKVQRDPSVMNQLKRGSQKISIKNMVLLLVATNVVLAGLIYNKNRKLKASKEM